MERLTEAILRMTNELPEGASVTAKMLLHLGTRPAIDQSLAARSERQAAQGGTRHLCGASEESVWDASTLG